MLSVTMKMEAFQFCPFWNAVKHATQSFQPRFARTRFHSVLLSELNLRLLIISSGASNGGSARPLSTPNVDRGEARVIILVLRTLFTLCRVYSPSPPALLARSWSTSPQTCCLFLHRRRLFAVCKRKYAEYVILCLAPHLEHGQHA